MRKLRKKPGFLEFRTPRCPQCTSKRTTWIYEGWRGPFKILSIAISVAFGLCGFLWALGGGLCATVVLAPAGLFLLLVGCPLALLSYAVMLVLFVVMRLVVPICCHDCGYASARQSTVSAARCS
jgi:hypothetical protein